jgi:hypothetical protein
MAERLPILVLAGSDPEAGPVPKGLDAGEMLTGYKGACRLSGGRCLVAELVERIRKCERFDDPIVVAPRRVFEQEVDCEIVDVDGPLITTLNRVIEVLEGRFRDAFAPVALSTCDILPTPEEFCQLLEAWYEPAKQCMLWWELVESEPERLGASAWKPSYPVPVDVGEPVKNVYPGHLVILRPKSLRTRLLVHFLRMAYRYRNWSARTRHLRMILHGLGRLMVDDVRNLFVFKAPLLTVSVPYTGLRTYRRFRRGELTLRELERSIGKTVLHREFQHAAQGRPVVFPLTPILSFAKDIDTHAELAEVAAQAG